MKLDFYIKTLLEENVVAIPTETVYGLAGLINSEKALNKIFETKDRPFFDPLIVHVASLEQAKTLTQNWSPIEELLASEFWPGPLSIIKKKNGNVSDLITSGLDTVALRCPNHPIALELLKQLPAPLAAPSANPFKKTSPTTLQHVKDYFPDLPVIDGGDCEVGIESTILEVKEDHIALYRPGLISKDDLERVLTQNDLSIPIISEESPAAPGQLKHHYMPDTPIITYSNISLTEVLNSISPELIQSPYFWVLPNNPKIVARELYSQLKSIDKNSFSSLIIGYDPQFKSMSHWDGILNRLDKAATIKL